MRFLCEAAAKATSCSCENEAFLLTSLLYFTLLYLALFYSALADYSFLLLFTRRESTQLLIDKTDCDYICWLSVDAIIVDINFKIESLIKWQVASDTDLVVARYYAVVNLITGLWKSSSFNSLLLQDLLEIMRPISDCIHERPGWMYGQKQRGENVLSAKAPRSRLWSERVT
eukprot:s1590_g31.t1